MQLLSPLALAVLAALLTGRGDGARYHHQGKHHQHSHHLRVRLHTKLAALYEQCEWEDRAYKCESTLQCISFSDTYGQCLKKRPGEWEQCGGSSRTGPWNTTCDGSSLACVHISDDYSQCQDTGAKQTSKPANSSSATVGEFEQCKWADGRAECGDGLQCIEESNTFGRCMKTVAELWGQCGGKSAHGPWTASCPSGATCKHWDDWYSQCVTGDAVDVNAQSSTAVTTTPSTGAKVWGQCGGDASYTGPTQCEDGLECIQHSQWYSQCKPNELPVGELCAQNDGGSNVWIYPQCADGASCAKSSNTEWRCIK